MFAASFDPVASVLIPTRDRASKLATCLAHLSRQSVPNFEVVVALDGPDPASKGVCDKAKAAGLDLRLVEGPRDGYMVARNRALKVARGQLVISINDDVRPAANFVEAHLAAHDEGRAKGLRLCIISGDSPWITHEPDRVFDRLIRETSMVFFYPVMEKAAREEPEATRWRDWGFRHAWGLNTSIPMWALREVGPYAEYAGKYGYEDVEMVHRICHRFGPDSAGVSKIGNVTANVPVLYRPEACAPHDHRMQPLDYLTREYRLGYTAWSFARVSSRCARELFRRDLTVEPEKELERALQHVAEKREAAQEAARLLEQSATIPAAEADVMAGFAIDAAYQAHLPAKRWMWQFGLADALRGYECFPERAVGELRGAEE